MPEPLRNELGERLLHWPDAVVREHAAPAFAKWGDHQRLLGLVDDPSFVVCKMVMYYLREVGPDPELAEFAWARLERAWSTDGHEALESAIALSEPESWIERVTEIAADPTREESLRFCAISISRKSRSGGRPCGKPAHLVRSARLDLIVARGDVRVGPQARVGCA